MCCPLGSKRPRKNCRRRTLSSAGSGLPWPWGPTGSLPTGGSGRRPCPLPTSLRWQVLPREGIQTGSRGPHRRGKATVGPLPRLRQVPAVGGREGGEGAPLSGNLGVSSEAPRGPHTDWEPGCLAGPLPARASLPHFGGSETSLGLLCLPGTTWANNDPFKSLALASGQVARDSNRQPDNPLETMSNAHTRVSVSCFLGGRGR